MKDTQFAGKILNDYIQQNQQLLNTYCQLKERHPYESFTDYAKAIWRVQMSMEVWGDIAALLEGDAYSEGGDDEIGEFAD